MKNFLKNKKSTQSLSALKTRRNKVLKEKVSFYLLYFFFYKIFYFSFKFRMLRKSSIILVRFLFS